jgi:PAS domain S-box-containing protein
MEANSNAAGPEGGISVSGPEFFAGPDGDAGMAKKRILVVEDDPTLAKGLQRLLMRLGYEVLGPVADGEDAVRYAKDSEPDLALMDISLRGEMDGIEAAEKIRSVVDIPVIYLTARSDQSTLDRAKVTEPYGYLLKPFSERELFVTVETAVYKAAMENRLKDSELRYRSLFENCPAALFELDLSECKSHLDRLKNSGVEDMGDYLGSNPDELSRCIEESRVICANQAAVDLFDSHDTGAFAGDLKRFFSPDSQDGTIPYLVSVCRGMTAFRGSATLKTLRGEEISTMWTSSVFEGHEKTFSRVSLCLLDVTERKRAEEALQKAHDELENRVEERTADLCRAVDHLHREIGRRKNTEESLRQRLEELDAINRVSRAVNSSLLQEQVLRCAHDEIVSALNPDMVAVHLHEGDTLFYQEIGSRSLHAVIDRHATKSVGECLCGLAVAESRSQYCLDIRADPRCTLSACKQAGLRSLAALPLRVGDQVLGVIALGSSPERDFRHHAAFLETLSSHLAVALQNAKLHRQVNDAKEELEQRVIERTSELAESNMNLQREIKERKLVEEALRHSEEKYRAIFDNAAIGIDLVGPDGRFVETNSALGNMLGYHQQELEKLTILEVTHPDDVEASRALHGALTQGELSTYRLEKRYLRRDGEVVWTDLSASVILDREGHYQGTVGVITDITDRKRYEKSQAQLVDEIRNFAYIVSHDLRSPLVNLRGFSRELREAIETIRPAVEWGLSHVPEDRRSEIREAMDEDIPECFAFIGSSISHMNKQVSGILSLSRLGSSELRFEPLLMNEIVEEILSTFAYEIGQRGLTISVDALPNIVADRTAIEQIVANLVGNAIKYLEPDRVGNIQIRGERLLEETRFEVRDNGRGIRAEDLPRIFDIFQRVGRLDVSGEGMGLSYVRTLVRRHGGRVWCESSPGVESSFFFTIAHPARIETPGETCGSRKEVRLHDR